MHGAAIAEVVHDDAHVFQRANGHFQIALKLRVVSRGLQFFSNRDHPSIGPRAVGQGSKRPGQVPQADVQYEFARGVEPGHTAAIEPA